MTSINYDPAAPYYDATRGFRPGVSERFRAAVRHIAGADAKTRYLELAIGSGLIGLPFIAAGDDYAGVDLSRRMLALLPPKAPAGSRILLAQADIARALPFAHDGFDVLLAVRIFHLLDDWGRCLDECRRLLSPGGQLIIVEVRTPPEATSPPPWSIVHDKWGEILRGMGIAGDMIRHGNDLSEAAIASHIRATGGQAQVIELMRFTELAVSCRTMVERRAALMFSDDWALPTAIHRQAARQLQDWLEHECERPDELSEREMVFRAVVAQYD